MHDSCPLGLARCEDSVQLDNGMVTLTTMYTCDSGFELVGDAATTCPLAEIESAELRLVPPFCRRECSE